MAGLASGRSERYLAAAPVNGTNEVQKLTIGGTPTGGTFTLSFEGFTSSAITWSATNSTLLSNMQTALDAMDCFDTNGCVASADVLTAGIGTIYLTFKTLRGKQAIGSLITATSSLTGTAPTLAIAEYISGVDASRRSAPTGARVVNTLTGDVYRNISSTSNAPNWVPQGAISVSLGSPALGTTTAVHAAVTDNGAEQTVTTAITNPAVCRNITATAGGTATDIKAIQVTVYGTNIDGELISETLPAFTLDTAGTVVGSKAFKTVTKIVIPAHDGTGATTAIGTGAKLGLKWMKSRNDIAAAYLNGTKEGTAPTVVADADEIEKNTVTLNSALDGTEVIITSW